MVKKIIWSFSIFSILFLSAAGVCIKYYIPESINLVAGQAQELCYKVPLTVSFYNEENIIVSGLEPNPVEDNIKIDLDKKTEIMPLAEGKTTAEISAFGIPIKKVSVNIISPKKVVACGTIIGIVMKTDGILVLGTGGIKNENGAVFKPAEGKIKTGDIILRCNGKVVEEKEQLTQYIEETSGEAVNLEIKRNEKNMNVSLMPTENEWGEYKIGVWVRDSTQGLGTVTYIDEATMTYGALGHGIYDVDTKTIMPIGAGTATLSKISGIKMGESGEPGEVCGSLDKSHVIGTVGKNTEQGIYGNINHEGLKALRKEPIEVGLMQEVKEGNAVILSDILGCGVEEYTVNIENINRFSGTDKGMVVRITDKRLLEKTGGIIQGMSGSPIIQNGKLIGAVTHVFVKDSTKGYGIFIENMLCN